MVLEDALVTSSTPYCVSENGWIALRESESEKIFYYDSEKKQRIELPDKYQMSMSIFVEIKTS